MPTVEILKPNIITFEYKQNKDDEDYGSCLWARFNLDLINYSISIESDCGNYSYRWVATPETESFLHLCSRFNKGYLLEKFSSKSVINNKETWTNVYKVISDRKVDIQKLDLNDLQAICVYCSNEFAFISQAECEVKTLGLNDVLDVETLWDCIVTDYPIRAITIVDIFIKYIVPKIKEYEKEQEDKQ